jgi:GNAT superfamily N-acetyltransferase
MTAAAALTGLVIREAEVADLQSLVAMLADDPLGAQREGAPDDPAYAAALAAIVANPADTLLVAVRDGTVIGCLQLTLLRGLSHRGMTRAQIEGVRVATAARNQGVGAALVAAALDRARAAGAGMAQLTTHASRADAHRFYARLGFEATHVGMKRTL